MRQGKSLIGMTVVGHEDGMLLGTIQDLIFDHGANQVLALVLNEEDLFGLVYGSVVPWREVNYLEGDMVLVKNLDSQISLRDDEQLRNLAATHRDTMLSDTIILTSDGCCLGTLADMVIDELTGQVTGYEVSNGYVADTLHGKKFLPASTDFRVGKDTAIVPSSAVEALQSGHH